jgi:hypothetical protein
VLKKNHSSGFKTYWFWIYKIENSWCRFRNSSKYVETWIICCYSVRLCFDGHYMWLYIRISCAWINCCYSVRLYFDVHYMWLYIKMSCAWINCCYSVRLCFDGHYMWLYIRISCAWFLFCFIIKRRCSTECKGLLISLHVAKAYGRLGHSFTHSYRQQKRMVVVKFRLRSVYPVIKIPHSHLNKGMYRLHNIHSGRFEDQKNLEIEPRFLCRPPHGLVTIHSTICYTLTLLNIHVLLACVAFFEQEQFKGQPVH